MVGVSIGMTSAGVAGSGPEGATAHVLDPYGVRCLGLYVGRNSGHTLVCCM